jgi:hypothetical protein
LAQGGALETVVDGVTGVLFDSPEPDALLAAIGRSENLSFDRHALAEHSDGFSTGHFHREMQRILKSHGVSYERPL